MPRRYGLEPARPTCVGSTQRWPGAAGAPTRRSGHRSIRIPGLRQLDPDRGRGHDPRGEDNEGHGQQLSSRADAAWHQRVDDQMIKLGVGSPANYLLATTGRKTGRPGQHRSPWSRVTGEQWLVAPYGAVGWVHNVRSTPEVSLRRGRSTRLRSAVEVDAQTAGPVLHRYVRGVRVTAPFFDAEASDPVELFVDEAKRHPVFRLIDDCRAEPTNGASERPSADPQ